MADKKYSRYINQIQVESLVDDIHSFVQTEDTSLKDKVINELQREANTRISADSKINEKLNNETKARLTNVRDINNKIGNLADLDTLEKGTIVGSINSEMDRAIEAETTLTTNLNNEINRAVGEENAIDSKLDKEIADARAAEKDLNNRLNAEVSRATNAESGLQSQIIINNDRAIAAEGDLKSKDWTSTINYSEEVDKTDLATAIYTEHKRAVKSEGDLSDLESLFPANTGKVSKEAADAQWSKETPNLSNAIISSSLLDVKLDSNTTQNITGGLNITDGVTVDTLKVNDKVDGDLNINGNATITQNTIINGNVGIDGYTKIDNNTDISGQVTIKKKTTDTSSGNLVTEGNINANGDVTIEGNLIVKGETVTEMQKTLEVDDNLIVTRANAETSPITPSGVVININSIFDSETGERTSNNSMGIVYNPNTDSVDLGIGQLIESENNNEFNIIESNPIVIRDDSDSIKNNEFIIWEKETKEFNGQSYVSVRAISSGIGKNSTTNETFANNDKDNSFVGVANRLNTNEINTNTNILNILNEIARAKDAESVITNTLNNEIDRAKAAENVLTQNINKEIDGREAADTQLQTNIDNEASIREAADTQLQTNIDNEIARATKVETTLQTNINNERDRAIAAENSKAPISHAVNTGIYGVGTPELYGHVKTDIVMSATSTNVMQTGALNTYLQGDYKTDLKNYLNNGFCTDEEATSIKNNLQNQINSNDKDIETINTNIGNLTFDFTTTGNDVTSAINTEHTRATLEEDDIRSNLDENTVFTKEIPTTVTLGGLTKGSNINGKTVVEILNSILFPYVSFSGVGLTLNVGAGTFYKGETAILKTFTPRWTNGSENINSIVLKQGSTQLYSGTSATNGGAINITDVNVTSNTTFTLTLSDGTTTLSANASYSFVDPEYYGVTSQENVNKILAGTATTTELSTWLTKTKNIPSTINMNANISCPILISTNSYSSIKDANNFECIDIFPMTRVILNGVNYYVYAAAPSTGSYTYKLS